MGQDDLIRQSAADQIRKLYAKALEDHRSHPAAFEHPGTIEQFQSASYKLLPRQAKTSDQLAHEAYLEERQAAANAIMRRIEILNNAADEAKPLVPIWNLHEARRKRTHGGKSA